MGSLSMQCLKVGNNRYRVLFYGVLQSTPTDMRFCRQVGLSDKVAMFNKQADQHHEKQARNPFSAAEGATLQKPTLDKNDPNYGR